MFTQLWSEFNIDVLQEFLTVDAEYRRKQISAFDKEERERNKMFGAEKLASATDTEVPVTSQSILNRATTRLTRLTTIKRVLSFDEGTTPLEDKRS